MYDSLKSIMELYMTNRQHGRMILESIENGPLIWPTIKENGVTRPRKYPELTHAKAIQADCDVKATNIILQGLPPEVYSLVSNHRIDKELWERIQLLMQGTSLTKQERECKHYDEFDKFTYKKGETLHVKLVRDLHTTNIDQLHAYLGQHEFHANEVHLMHERNSDLLALVVTHQMTQRDKFLLQWVPLGPILQKQVEAILGNNELLFVTTAKGKDICPNSALNLKGKGLIPDLRIKYYCQNQRDLPRDIPLDSVEVLRLVPSCFVIFDLELLSLSFDFVFMSEIFKFVSFSLDRLCRLAILCLDQHAHTLHHLESLLTISLDRLNILKEDLCIS
uniref:Uncharacterized mitochondrial protein AtMg00810-like n=1 Tax=Tanacetum cinerariifolium TaxID=118510 RepID=A0A6L2JHP3_TANCI|nr:uncharacterized mitochondrial protein AtMg00810-like [Tanacetum cinerariifolium]